MKALLKDPAILEVIDPDCGTTRLHTLSKDPFWLIRALVAMHQNTADYTLTDLSCDEDLSVLSGVAANSHTDAGIIRSLAWHESEVVRCGAAANPDLQEEDLQWLESDKIQMVKDAAARNRQKRN